MFHKAQQLGEVFTFNSHLVNCLNLAAPDGGGSENVILLKDVKPVWLEVES